jgi:hypothetical protein
MYGNIQPGLKFKPEASALATDTPYATANPAQSRSYDWDDEPSGSGRSRRTP